MRRKKPLLTIRLSELPCPTCKDLAVQRLIRPETVQRLPPGAFAPRLRTTGRQCCFDCASADGLTGRMGLTFEMARIAVGNDRQEQYRRPGAPLGLVGEGIVRPSKPGDLEEQHAWLERMRWFDIYDIP